MAAPRPVSASCARRGTATPADEVDLAAALDEALLLVVLVRADVEVI